MGVILALVLLLIIVFVIARLIFGEKASKFAKSIQYSLFWNLPLRIGLIRYISISMLAFKGLYDQVNYEVP